MLYEQLYFICIGLTLLENCLWNGQSDSGHNVSQNAKNVETNTFGKQTYCIC